MHVEIVTIGNEVLSGRTLDTNFAFLARALEEADVQVAWHTTVGDTAPAISTALRAALDRSDAVVMTGGLGPTPDDLTRKAVASVLRRPLQLDETVLEHIRERAKKFRRKAPASIESQALIPRGAEVWRNPVGTAPGLLILTQEKPVILLPGVPAEMEALATEFVVPYLRARTGRFVETFTLRTSGVWESMLHEKIGKLPQKWPGATLAYLPSYFGVDLRVTVSGRSEDDVHTVTGRAYDELRRVAAPVIYAEGSATIEQVVGEVLAGKGWRAHRKRARGAGNCHAGDFDMMNPEATFQLPVQMSAAAAEIDALYYGIYWFSVAFTVAIYAATVYFIFKYKRRANVKAEPTPDLLKLEVFWTVTPVIFIVFLFHASFSAYIKNVTPAEDAMEIRVRGKKWSWEFEYPNGSREPSALTIPVNKPVKLVLSSDDVIHSFFIPAVRLKRDAVPGLYTTVTFTPNRKGDAQVFCAEFCGTSHSGMLATIHVVDDKEYIEHLDKLDKMPEVCDGQPCTPSSWGKQLFTKYACNTCHSTDGTRGRGPSLKGVFGTMQPTLQAGDVMADENYVRESILRPQAKIVAGYTDTQMPVFVMKDNQIDALIAYVKTLK